jgi:hypothetical protein
MNPEEAHEQWWKAYDEYASPYSTMAIEIVTKAAGHYGFYGHFPTDPFIQPCLICGKEW